MPVTRDQSAPYAPAGVILNLLGRYREKGLPAPITSDVLSRAGVPDSLNSRTLQALLTLDLIDEAGQPSPVFEGLRLAPTAELKTRMAEWLNSAYADALSFIDPATAPETEVRDAFRSYKPFGQQDRMVSLFLGLYEAAGIAPERKKKSAPKSQNNNSSRAQSPTRNAKGSAVNTVVAATQGPPREKPISGLPPALGGLLASLPQQGDGWSKTQRDLFVQTFGAVLDFCYPVISGVTQKKTAQIEECDD